MFPKNVQLFNTSINVSSVNSANCSNISRDVSDVKKKWQDLSSQTKKREAERRRRVGGTGGGPSIEDDLKSWEQKIVGTISRSAVEGVPGGVDTSEVSQSLVLLENEAVNVLEATPASTCCQLKPSLPESACSDEQEVQFETVIFANPSSEVNSLDEHSSRKLQNKMKRKRPYCNGDKESDNIRREFLDGEKEKNRSLEVYRKKKIALYEKMVQQQSEMLELQKRSTAALEIIAYKSAHSLQPSSPFSVSPVINFNS